MASLIFASKTRAYPSGANCGAPFFGKIPILTKQKLDKTKKLARDKRARLFLIQTKVL